MRQYYKSLDELEKTHFIGICKEEIGKAPDKFFEITKDSDPKELHYMLTNVDEEFGKNMLEKLAKDSTS